MVHPTRRDPLNGWMDEWPQRKLVGMIGPETDLMYVGKCLNCSLEVGGANHRSGKACFSVHDEFWDANGMKHFVHAQE